ncbi:MAG TPA: chemotaxis protein CheD [Candidatus Methylacidiphilales bacterium]
MNTPLTPSSTSGTDYRETIVGVADIKMASGASWIITTYALGSCLGITLYDPAKKIGGMLHAMLPDSKLHQSQGATKIAMFLDSGMNELLAQLRKAGANERNLECKVFGGSQVMSADKFFRIGDRNVETFKTLSQSLGLRVGVWEVGGHVNRTIKFYLESGQVSVRTPNQPLFWK